MEIHRAEHRQNFTVISNHLIKDNRLSEKARLFLIFVLSLPEDWNFSVSGIAVQFGKSPGAIRRLLQELEEYGYLIRKQARNEEGLFEAGQFVFYEEPAPHTLSRHLPDGTAFWYDIYRSREVHLHRCNRHRF